MDNTSSKPTMTLPPCARNRSLEEPKPTYGGKAMTSGGTTSPPTTATVVSSFDATVGRCGQSGAFFAPMPPPPTVPVASTVRHVAAPRLKGEQQRPQQQRPTTPSPSKKPRKHTEMGTAAAASSSANLIGAGELIRAASSSFFSARFFWPT